MGKDIPRGRDGDLGARSVEWQPGPPRPEEWCGASGGTLAMSRSRANITTLLLSHPAEANPGLLLTRELN